eukprot:11980337-Karenia_brevis.AAC.1
MLKFFKPRKDKQIMGLELLAISLALCTFRNELREQRVVVYCDNKGSEIAVRRGTARAHDHA